jgi:hypothetical protein
VNYLTSTYLTIRVLETSGGPFHDEIMLRYTTAAPKRGGASIVTTACKMARTQQSDSHPFTNKHPRTADGDD